MNTMQKIIYVGFATVALASAAQPAFSATTLWPGVDFEWYADVGKPLAGPLEPYPAPREGYIWAPGRYEWNGAGQVWEPGVWIRDDFHDQVAAYANGNTTYASGPLELRDREGNVIPLTPDAYPVDSARR